MPAFDTTHRPYTQLARYGQLGDSLPAAIVGHLLASPRLLWTTLVTNTLSDTAHDYIKLELWVGVLLSGGRALLRRPWYALMLVPILAQKLLASDAGFWGLNYQYSIEIAPVLTLAVTDALLRAGRPATGRWVWALAAAAGFMLVMLYTRRSTWYDRTTTNFLLGSHYRPAYPDRAGLRVALARGRPGYRLALRQPWYRTSPTGATCFCFQCCARPSW